MITQEELKTYLIYNPLSGNFFWRKQPSYKIPLGSIAGTYNDSGYIIIGILGNRYRAHRLAFLYMLGKMPKNQVDHIDGDRSNNRWKNLREVTPLVNAQNVHGASKNNKSGYLGVSWSKQHQKWRANLYINKKQTHLGLFDTPEEAHACYLAAKAEHHIGWTNAMKGM